MKSITKTIILVPFAICVGFLLVLGKCLEISYKQISIIFNLYLQGGILFVTEGTPLGISAWLFITNISWTNGHDVNGFFPKINVRPQGLRMKKVLAL